MCCIDRLPCWVLYRQITLLCAVYTDYLVVCCMDRLPCLLYPFCWGSVCPPQIWPRSSSAVWRPPQTKRSLLFCHSRPSHSIAKHKMTSPSIRNIQDICMCIKIIRIFFIIHLRYPSKQATDLSKCVFSLHVTYSYFFFSSIN